MKKVKLKKLEKELNDLVKKIVIKRDKNRCVYCGAKNNLQVHHIVSKKYLSTRYDPANLITLCNRCHLKISKSTFERDKFLIFLICKKGLEKIQKLHDKVKKGKRLTRKELEFLIIYYKTILK